MPVNRRTLLPAAVSLLLVPILAGAAPAPEVQLSPYEAAAVTINVADLLANEPGLPLPVRQRADALIAYYQTNVGPLLWVGKKRMNDFVAREEAATYDGLKPESYPSDQLARLATIAATTDARSRAIIAGSTSRRKNGSLKNAGSLSYTNVETSRVSVGEYGTSRALSRSMNS